MISEIIIDDMAHQLMMYGIINREDFAELSEESYQRHKQLAEREVIKLPWASKQVKSSFLLVLPEEPIKRENLVYVVIENEEVIDIRVALTEDDLPTNETYEVFCRAKEEIDAVRIRNTLRRYMDINRPPMSTFQY